MKILPILLFPFASIAQADTASFPAASAFEWTVLYQHTLGTETLVVADSGVTIQIEKSPVCDFFGRYDPVDRKAYYVVGDSCTNQYRVRQDGDEFSYIFTDALPKSACAYCICFSAAGIDFVAMPDGTIQFDGRVILRSFSAYLTIYTFIQQK